MKLSDKIDEILWLEWDPIDVNDVEDARDEYSSYVTKLYSLKMQGADRQTIAAALFEIETKRMCLIGDMEHCDKIAGRIIEL